MSIRTASIRRIAVAAAVTGLAIAVSPAARAEPSEVAAAPTASTYDLTKPLDDLGVGLSVARDSIRMTPLSEADKVVFRSDPLAGNMTMDITPDSNGGWSVDVTEFTLHNATEAAADDSPPPRTVTIDQDDQRATRSTLRWTGQSYEHVVEVPLRFTVGTGEPGQELVLTTKQPARFVGTLGQFPPNADTYQLAGPVELAFPGSSDNTMATLTRFPVQAGG